MKMKPIGDLILLKEREKADKTKAGIILVDGIEGEYVYADVIAVGPGLFTGLITLGIVMQVSNAFQRVHGGFALFLHNWTTITELRSIWKRLNEFEDNLTLYENKNTIETEKS